MTTPMEKLMTAMMIAMVNKLVIASMIKKLITEPMMTMEKLMTTLAMTMENTLITTMTMMKLIRHR